MSAGERLAGWSDSHGAGDIAVSSEDSTPEQAATLIHELLHVERPGWTEGQVQGCEDAVCASIRRNPGPWMWIVWSLTRG